MRAAKAVWHVIRRLTRERVISNYRQYCESPPRRRALLSYLVQPLLPPSRLRNRTVFSPFGIAQAIPRALNEMGYSVDIVGYDNVHWQPRRSYDLFIGHGALNFERLADAAGPGATRIYFASGVHCRTWNSCQAERVRALALRTGQSLPPGRPILIDEQPAYALADSIIHLGNAHAAASFAQFRNVRGINNAFYPVTWAGWKTKDYTAARREFLFYAGPGNVHKGLDCAIEAFASLPGLHLHVCQDIAPPFQRIYEPILSRAANIHLHGFIRQRSARFYDLARRCNWVLLPTCAEGQPGSVVEMMAHGLVPILPAAANIDLDWWGIPLEGCSPAQVAESCSSASQAPAARCQAMAEATLAETRARYSIECFRANFQEAVRATAEAGRQQSSLGQGSRLAL